MSRSSVDSDQLHRLKPDLERRFADDPAQLAASLLPGGVLRLNGLTE
jgi:hypothetical protein